MNQELKQIKKLYGEKFSHLCRDLFSTILENNGMLLEILTEQFAPTHFLYDDILSCQLMDDFKNYICNIYYDKLNKSVLTEKERIKETPEELMEKVGYILKECATEEQVQAYKKYYSCGEELCTFNGERLDSCRVFFAVKKNVLDIKREDFKTPRRQDEYGTSVISIQFTKDGTNTLSIKNRYNHTVDNPDSTFSNNLDNIVAGLTESFENTYGIVQRYKSDNFEIPYYVRANDGRFYKYNYEIGNVYYCPNNIIIDNSEVKKFDKEKYIIFDYFILDLVGKYINTYQFIFDSFRDGITKISKINILKEENNRRIILIPKIGENIEILINDYNQIIEYKNNNITEVGICFLDNNRSLEKIECLNIRKIGDSFLSHNGIIKQIDLPNLEVVGDDFLYSAFSLKSLKLPKLTSAGGGFVCYGEDMEQVDLPKLNRVGDYFLCYNKKIKQIDLPNLEDVGDVFLSANEFLKTLMMPKLKKVGKLFLRDNKKIKQIELSNLIEVGDQFLEKNENLEIVNCPNLKKVGAYFLRHNLFLEELITPKLEFVGHYFLLNNKRLKSMKLPNLIEAKDQFLADNEILESINCPKLKSVGAAFLKYNDCLKELIAPELEKIGADCLICNNALEKIEIPKVVFISDNFLLDNTVLKVFLAPNLETVGSSFMHYNNSLKILNCPNLKYIDEYFLSRNECLEEINCAKNVEILPEFNERIVNMLKTKRKNLVK